jgi:hypothetical protein
LPQGVAVRGVDPTPMRREISSAGPSSRHQRKD